MSSRFILPFADVGSGIKPPSGAQLFFFETDGVTPKNTYTDSTDSVANANPVIANANGVFGDVYISGSYKVTLKDNGGVQIFGLADVNEYASVSDSVFVKSFDTLIGGTPQSSAAESISLSDGDSVTVKERFAGGNAGGTWDVVLTSTVTPNTFDIVQSVGTPTLSLVLRVENVLEIDKMGFIADESTDNSAVMNRVIALIGDDLKIVRFPSGGGLFTDINLPVNTQGIIFEGVGAAVTGGVDGTKLRNNGTTPMFKSSGAGSLTNITFRNISFFQTSTSQGDIFAFLSSVNRLNIEEVYFSLINPTATFLKISAVSISNIRMINIIGFMAESASDSAFDLTALVGGNMFNITTDTVMVNSNDTAVAPIFRYEDVTGGSTSFGVVFRSTTLELAGNGGGIHLFSIRNPLFENVIADDSLSNNQPIVLVDSSAVPGSRPPLGCTFINCWMRDGTNSFPDIKIVPGTSGTQTTVIGSDIGWIDTSTKPFVNISSIVTNKFGSTEEIKMFSGEVKIPSTGSFKHSSNITVPESQHGMTGVISPGASVVVNFPLPFTAAPDVVVTHNGATTRSGPLTVTAISTTQVTIYNRAAQSTTAHWLAMN